MLKFRKIYFFDFEYGGLDDIAKLLADFILQPNYPLNQIKRFFLEYSPLNLLILDNYWISRLQFSKPFVFYQVVFNYVKPTQDDTL